MSARAFSYISLPVYSPRCGPRCQVDDCRFARAPVRVLLFVYTKGARASAHVPVLLAWPHLDYLPLVIAWKCAAMRRNY